MQHFYPLIIAFLLIFLSELGDKTQILVLSFSSKMKTATILIGVAIGSFLSHGLAILFGSAIGNTSSIVFHQILEIITYLSFIIIGIFSLSPRKAKKEEPKNSALSKLSKYKLNYIFIIAASIAIGEIGDKTFLASIGLGIEYSYAKVLLIIGAIAGMCASDLIAIVFGKLLSKQIPEKAVERLSSILFLIFGILGLIRFFT